MNPKRPIPGRTMSATMPQHATAGAWHTKTLNAWCKERTCWNLRRICHTASPLPQANKTRPSFMIFMGCRGDRISILFLWNCTMRNIIRLIHCNVYVCMYIYSCALLYCILYWLVWAAIQMIGGQPCRPKGRTDGQCEHHWTGSCIDIQALAQSETGKKVAELP